MGEKYRVKRDIPGGYAEDASVTERLVELTKNMPHQEGLQSVYAINVLFSTLMYRGSVSYLSNTTVYHTKDVIGKASAREQIQEEAWGEF